MAPLDAAPLFNIHWMDIQRIRNNGVASGGANLTFWGRHTLRAYRGGYMQGLGDNLHLPQMQNCIKKGMKKLTFHAYCGEKIMFSKKNVFQPHQNPPLKQIPAYTTA